MSQVRKLRLGPLSDGSSVSKKKMNQSVACWNRTQLAPSLHHLCQMQELPEWVWQNYQSGCYGAKLNPDSEYTHRGRKRRDKAVSLVHQKKKSIQDSNLSQTHMVLLLLQWQWPITVTSRRTAGWVLISLFLSLPDVCFSIILLLPSHFSRVRLCATP